MLQTPDRRQFLKTAAGAALPLVVASSAAGRPTGLIPSHADHRHLHPRLHRDHTNRPAGRGTAQPGIRTVQLFFSQTDSRYWKYNGRSDVSDMTADRCQAIAAPIARPGVAIHSIGVYTNLIHPDAAERKANLAYFEA